MLVLGKTRHYRGIRKPRQRRGPPVAPELARCQAAPPHLWIRCSSP